jgi:predicted nucleic acid-binding protein
VSTPRVFADTNTLCPIYVCDLLLRCAEEGLFEFLWTEDLLAELVEVIPRSGRKSVRAVESMCAAIRAAFPDGEIPRKAYDDLVETMPGTDPDDRPHSAAAVRGHADILLTRDTAGFPPAALAHLGVRVTDVDTFLCGQFDQFPDDLVRIIDCQIQDLTSITLTRCQLLDRLCHPAGAARFAGVVSRYLTDPTASR